MNQKSVAFCLEAKTDIPHDTDLADRQKEASAWAHNPANAISLPEKPFDPQNLSVFIDRVIEKANAPAPSSDLSKARTKPKGRAH